MSRRPARFAALAAAVVLASAGTLGVGTAGAASNGSWEILPQGAGRVYLFYTLAPGREVDDAVTVRNTTATPLALDLYAADAVNTPGNGAFGILGARAPKTGVASWVRLSTSRLVLPPGGTTTVPFQLVVPAGARAGDSAGAVVAADATASGELRSGTADIAVVRAVGVRMYVRVTGDLHAALAIGGLHVRPPPALSVPLASRRATVISYTVTNAGDVREAPVATVTVTDELGRTIARLPRRQLPELLPGGRLAVSAVWKAMPPAGRFRVHVSVEAGAAGAAGEVTIWYLAWGDVVLAAGLLAVAVLAAHRWRRRSRADGEDPTAATSVVGGGVVAGVA